MFGGCLVELVDDFDVRFEGGGGGEGCCRGEEGGDEGEEHRCYREHAIGLHYAGRLFVLYRSRELEVADRMPSWVPRRFGRCEDVSRCVRSASFDLHG